MMTMPLSNSTCSTNCDRPESLVRLQSPPLLLLFLLFDRAAGFLPVPTVDFARRRAQAAVKAGRHSASKAFSGVSRPRLDSPEHGGSIGRSGPVRLARRQCKKLQSASQSSNRVVFDARW